MDEMKYLVLTKKTICLLEKNQYTFDVDKKSTKTEIKKWIKGFFGVEIIRMNSHQPPKKKTNRSNNRTFGML
jgi:large subunit ribosomal protein L23